MSNHDTPQEYSAEGKEWTPLLRLKDELTCQRDKLAKAYRLFEAGQAQGLDPLREIKVAHDAIEKVLPDFASAAKEGKPVEWLVRDLIADYWNQVEQRSNSVGTGFASLNAILSGGIESKRLIGVLGAPNTGKTTFVHQMADEMAQSGRPVYYVTSEDQPTALFAKTLARIGNVNYTAVLKGQRSEEAKIDRALAMQLDRKSTDRLRYLDATNGVTLDLIREKAAKHFAQYPAQNGGGSGVLIVDYLQRIARAIKTLRGLSADLREVVTLVTEQLRALACDLDCAVIAIASQNRTNYSRSSENGAMASAKESGDIEYTCDVLMALTEEKEAKRAVPSGQVAIQLHVDKNRQGQRGKTVALNFWPDRQQFTEIGQ